MDESGVQAMPGDGTAAWKRLRLNVLERDSWICAYCGGEANEADHIVPTIAGGKHTMDNLVAACKKCNGRKSDRALIRLDYINARWFPRS